MTTSDHRFRVHRLPHKREALVQKSNEEYEVAYEHVHSCCVFLAKVDKFKIDGQWHTWIDYKKFHNLVLEYWAGRGMLQIFVAVMTRAYPDVYGERHEVLLFRDIASFALLACGLICVASGILCLGFLKRARQNKKLSTQQAIKDLQDLERRRAELEALLIVDTP